MRPRRLGLGVLLGFALLALSGCWGDPTPPAAVTGLGATSTTTSVSLSWTNPPDYWGVIVRRADGPTPPSGPTAGMLVADVGDGTSVTDSGLIPSTTYTYAVFAYGATGYYSPAVTITIATPAATATVPGPPTIGTAAPGDAAVTLSWTAPASDGGSPVTGYEVTPYVASVGQTPVAFSSSATAQTLTGLVNGTTYTFTVAASNAAGTGTPSATSDPATPDAGYGLPIPLGSPLNYFGGDATRTVPSPVITYALDWPTDANSSGRPPAVAQVGETAQVYGCNVGTASAQGYGRWTDATTYSAGGFSGSTRCNYSVGFTSPGGTTSIPPPDYTRRAPTNPACNVFHGTTANGRWETATTYRSNYRYTSGTGFRQCTWAVVVTADLPSSYDGTNTPPGSAPVNRPCRVGYEVGLGWWGPTATSAWSTTAVPSGGNQSVGNRLCRWTTAITTTSTTPPNPIDSARSPGFWAQIEGPASVATNGDIYSTRCYTTPSCGSVENLLYKDPADPDAGYWYVVKVPAVAVASIDINVFDAAHNQDGNAADLAGDRSFSGGPTFPTEYRVYRQTNPLDVTSRTPVFASPTGDETDGSCSWHVNGGIDTSFKGTWRRLCTITAPNPGDTYLIQVTTPGTTGNGMNGYALEAVTGGSHANPNQPTLYAHANMGLVQNSSPQAATSYLAEVGPQHAGRTLVVDLWDTGDVFGGDASLYPKMPSATVPRPVQNVPASACSYTSSPSPNPVQSGLDPTGATYSSPQTSDDSTRCGIVTATGGVRRFSGTWLTIRIDIPTDYTCQANTPATPVNPEVSAGSCWWGIEYLNQTQTSGDVTTWQARIEDNPAG